MAELTPPVFLQAGGESAQTSRLAISAAVLSSGVVTVTDMTVTAPGGAMTVSVAAGQGWVVGSRASQGGYHVVNDAPKTVTITTSDPTNPRYDRIVAVINDAAYAGSLNSFVIAVVQGTASSSPVEPAIPADSFELARITVGAAVTTIAGGNVLDRRVRAIFRGPVFSAATTGDASLVVRAIAGQTGSIAEFQSPAGSSFVAVGANGSLSVSTYIYATSGITTGTAAFGGATYNGFSGPAGSAGVPVVVVKAIAGQTANFMEWQRSDGTALTSVSANGSVSVLGKIVLNSALQAIEIVTQASDVAPLAGEGQLYVLNGALRYRGPSGTLTTIAAS